MNDESRARAQSKVSRWLLLVPALVEPSAPANINVNAFILPYLYISPKIQQIFLSGFSLFEANFLLNSTEFLIVFFGRRWRLLSAARPPPAHRTVDERCLQVVCAPRTQGRRSGRARPPCTCHIRKVLFQNNLSRIDCVRVDCVRVAMLRYM